MKKKAVAKKPPVALGRKTKRTPEVAARIIDALKKGNTRRAACAYAGISDQTLANWCADSLDFLEALTRAENVAEFGYVDVIQECANNGDWKAAAWWLERRRKLEYSARQEVTGANGGAMQHEHNGNITIEQALEMSVEELARRQRDALGYNAETPKRW